MTVPLIFYSLLLIGLYVVLNFFFDNAIMTIFLPLCKRYIYENIFWGRVFSAGCIYPLVVVKSIE